ncbi:MAG: hypothetical protein HRT58_03450 [Crocinitomicaceae bacterium]|nr:hypothetical protein [Flavobacteriales bacterium]NQZ34688.1 hypothetical protein [Crocinitomicaceae bacterium]
MKRNFMFVAAIAAGMAMTACGGEVVVEDNLDEVADDAQEQVDSTAAEKTGMMDDLLNQAKDAAAEGMEDGKEAITDAVTDAVKEKAPELIEEGKKIVVEEGKKAVGM